MLELYHLDLASCSVDGFLPAVTDLSNLMFLIWLASLAQWFGNAGQQEDGLEKTDPIKSF